LGTLLVSLKILKMVGSRKVYLGRNNSISIKYFISELRTMGKNSWTNKLKELKRREEEGNLLFMVC